MRGQREAIYSHLKKNGSITSMQAFLGYGVTRLSAVVYDLRKMGHNIETHLEDGKTRFGETCKYAVYTLKEDK